MTVALITDFIREGCRVAEITVEEFFSKRKPAHLVRARRTVWRALKIRRKMTYPDIGRRCGGYDHSTIIYGIRKCEEQIQVDPEYAMQAEAVLHVMPISRPSDVIVSTRYPASPGLEDCPLQ